MARKLGSLVFTPVIKALQERYGSRRQYARLEEQGSSSDRLGADEAGFIAERDSFYMATVGATGWPYIQHRGGPTGFLKVIDEQTIAFPIRREQAVHQRRQPDDRRSGRADSGGLPAAGPP